MGILKIIKERLTGKRQPKRNLSEARIRALKNAGYSIKEISKCGGISESTIRTILKSQEKESK